jgi:uncharacterized protein
LKIYVDSDACPVKPEVMRVAKRYGLAVTFVANSWMRLPEDWGAELVVVEGQFDAADDWIFERIQQNDVLVSSDIPLVHRCLQKKAKALNSYGRAFTEESIGEIISKRDLMTVLRGSGEVTGGPAPFQKEDRSRFLQTMDQIIQDIKNGK